MSQSFTDRVKTLKEARNWTDSELARRSIRSSGKPLARQTVWYILNRAKELPTLETVAALARAFECTVEDLAA